MCLWSPTSFACNDGSYLHRPSDVVGSKLRSGCGRRNGTSIDGGYHESHPCPVSRVRMGSPGSLNPYPSWMVAHKEDVVEGIPPNAAACGVVAEHRWAYHRHYH